MIDELIAWLSTPVVVMGVVGSGAVTARWCRRVTYIHLFIMCVIGVLYVFMRKRFSKNLKEPASDELDRMCSVFNHEGMNMMWYRPPRKPKRKLLLFPGVCNSVRRMIRHDFVVPLLRDSVILCVQPRGLGDSDMRIHMNRATMMQDAQCAYELMLPFELPVHIMGYSAGSFMAIQLAATLDPITYASLTLVAGMFDCKDMVLDMRISCVAMNMYQSELTHHVPNTVLLLHSTEDKHIMLPEAKRHVELRMSSRLPVKLLEVKGKHHQYVIDKKMKRKMRTIIRACDAQQSKRLLSWSFPE